MCLSVAAGDAAVSATERESRRRDTEETCAGTTTFPTAAEAGTKDTNDDI